MKKHDTVAEPRSGPRQWGRAQRDPIIDPYRWTHKPSEPAFCPHCGAVYRDGRWRWATGPEGAREELCGRRINDKFPAGVVRLRGDFARKHKKEMIHLARDQEAAEKKEHPLNRIISIEEDEQGLVINTTDTHLRAAWRSSALFMVKLLAKAWIRRPGSKQW